MFAEASSKQARVAPRNGSAEPEQALSAAALEKTASLPKPQASQRQQLQELPFRSADGRWTCTYSTGGLNKNRWLVLLSQCCQRALLQAHIQFFITHGVIAANYTELTIAVIANGLYEMPVCQCST